MEPVELLVEQWNSPIEVIDTWTNQKQDGTLVEQISNNGKNLYIQGVFMQADVVNGNKRLYPKRVLEKAVNDYIKEQVNTKQQLGELNHPPRPFVDPKEVCLVIEKLWWEGNNVMGKARIVTGDNGNGDKVAALIRAGWIPGVSSRGLGRVVQKNGYNEVQEGFKLTVGVDIVWGPSAPGAYVKPITEQSIEQLNKPEKIVSEENINKSNSEVIGTISEVFEKYNKKTKDEKTFKSLNERFKTLTLVK